MRRLRAPPFPEEVMVRNSSPVSVRVAGKREDGECLSIHTRCGDGREFGGSEREREN